MTEQRRLIVCADDFGLDEAVNAAIETASREGILTCTSLMMGAPATADAVMRARRLPGLRVGLHLNLVEGAPLSPARDVPDLVRSTGEFDGNMLRAGLRFFFSPAGRRQLATEIRAQFVAFRATGLALDHVNSHCHMHVHPTVAGLVLRVGAEFGMRAVRMPDEPWRVMRRLTCTGEPRPLPAPHGPWIRLLRRRLNRAGLALNDRLFGIAWSGGVTESRILRLIAALPTGTSELYCHPATAQTPRLKRTMPDYQPTQELAALVSPAVRAAIAQAGIALVSYADLTTAAR